VDFFRVATGQELNIARHARGQAASRCFGFALFALGKVTAGVFRQHKGEGLHADD
jgi:hypothetical protein